MSILRNCISVKFKGQESQSYLWQITFLNVSKRKVIHLVITCYEFLLFVVELCWPPFLYSSTCCLCRRRVVGRSPASPRDCWPNAASDVSGGCLQ